MKKLLKKKSKKIKPRKKPKHAKTKEKRKKKIIFFVIDGMADLPINGKTPLSEAYKPNINYFASCGMIGELNLVPKNMFPSSNNANVALLGYNPARYYLKRGPLEAVGADIPYTEGQLAVRCNFATVDSELKVLDRRAGRNNFGLDQIARYVNAHVNIGVPHVFIRTFGHRAVLILKENLSDQITGNDPFINNEEVRSIGALDISADRTAKLVQSFVDKARSVIEYHPSNEQRIKNGMPPANYLIVRDAGNALPKLPNFLKQRGLQSAACIAENGVMKATCMLAGFNAISVPEVKVEANLKFIFEALHEAISEYDFVYVHIKWPDEPAHDGDFHRKREMIEAIDSKLDKLKNFSGIIVLTCDHITACKLRGHTHGNVPVLIYGLGGSGKKHQQQVFDEFTAKRGKLGTMSGKQLWDFVFKKIKC